jgi:hypothetical protein
MLEGFDADERASFAQMLDRIAANLAAARLPEVVNG